MFWHDGEGLSFPSSRTFSNIDKTDCVFPLPKPVSLVSNMSGFRSPFISAAATLVGIFGNAIRTGVPNEILVVDVLTTTDSWPVVDVVWWMTARSIFPSPLKSANARSAGPVGTSKSRRSKETVPGDVEVFRNIEKLEAVSYTHLRPRDS